MPEALKNVINSLVQSIESLTDDHKTPLHVGEVMTCWTYLAFVGNIVTYEEVALNTVTDPELKELIKDAKQVANEHKNKLSEFMKKEGVLLPPLSEDKPLSEPSAIPLGAKFTEEEIVNTLVINFVYAADTCAASASQSLRSDVGIMFLKFQGDKLTLGYRAKKLMQQKGWLKIPPYYQPIGTPNQTE